MQNTEKKNQQGTEKSTIGISSFTPGAGSYIPPAPTLTDLPLIQTTTQTDRFRTPMPFSVSGNVKMPLQEKEFHLQKGTCFRGYQIIRRLSSSAENPVFLVAPKENSDTLGNPDMGVLKLYPQPEDPQNFLDMMKKLSAKYHLQAADAIISPEILSYGLDEDKYVWSISKYMELPSLESFIQAKAPLCEHKTLFTIYNIANLLYKGYSLWGPHGRLKPSKILFALKKPPYLIGMGQSEFLYKNREKMLKNEDLFYASPEYISSGEITWQSDIYSLGIIFFRLLSGVLPFYSPSVEEVKKAHLTETLPPVSSKNVSVRISTPTLGILNRMTMKDPAKRFLSLEKLMEALIQADDALPQEEKE